jgi:hypothetical protein
MSDRKRFAFQEIMASIWSAGNHLAFLFCTAGCCQPCQCRPCSSSFSSCPGRSQPESQRCTATTIFSSGETFTPASCTVQRLLVLPLVCMTWRVAKHVATAMQSGLTAQQLGQALAHQGLLQGHQQPELQRHQLQQHSSLSLQHNFEVLAQHHTMQQSQKQLQEQHAELGHFHSSGKSNGPLNSLPAQVRPNSGWPAPGRVHTKAPGSSMCAQHVCIVGFYQ